MIEPRYTVAWPKAVHSPQLVCLSFPFRRQRLFYLLGSDPWGSQHYGLSRPGNPAIQRSSATASCLTNTAVSHENSMLWPWKWVCSLQKAHGVHKYVAFVFELRPVPQVGDPQPPSSSFFVPLSMIDSMLEMNVPCQIEFVHGALQIAQDLRARCIVFRPNFRVPSVLIDHRRDVASNASASSSVMRR